MKQLPIETDNDFGELILSNNKLAKTVRRNTIWISVATGVACAAIVALMVAPLKPPTISVFDPFGHLYVAPPTGTGERTLADKMFFARHLILNVRGRTGIASVDAQNLSEWSGQLTANAAATWNGLGPRWKNPGRVEHGFRRTIEQITVTADRDDANALSAEFIETDGTYGQDQVTGRYRVRVNLYFTDPKKNNGAVKLDGITLREEQKIR